MIQRRDTPFEKNSLILYLLEFLTSMKEVRDLLNLDMKKTKEKVVNKNERKREKKDSTKKQTKKKQVQSRID